MYYNLHRHVAVEVVYHTRTYDNTWIGLVVSAGILHFDTEKAKLNVHFRKEYMHSG